ncbi:MAG: SET domain-containing protein-lysine N-methyltransferase [Verrucomicrobiales bacterium]|nr:SET domain-containing protein-lysine N-methyltransferase [Verrucomicrobiales bacterium]
MTDKPYLVKNSPIHGHGLYAARGIRKGERVIEYIGEKITKAESQRRGTAHFEKSKSTGEGAVYLFVLNKRYDLDGNIPANVARLMNHSCDPNCEAEVIRGRIWYLAIRDIPAGEELTLNYGFDVENWDEHPCRCGTSRCVGYIVSEDQWKQLRREIQKRQAASTPSNGAT